MSFDCMGIGRRKNQRMGVEWFSNELTDVPCVEWRGQHVREYEACSSRRLVHQDVSCVGSVQKKTCSQNKRGKCLGQALNF
jgi:hypothetical protein